MVGVSWSARCGEVERGDEVGVGVSEMQVPGSGRGLAQGVSAGEVGDVAFPPADATPCPTCGSGMKQRAKNCTYVLAGQGALTPRLGISSKNQHAKASPPCERLSTQADQYGA